MKRLKRIASIVLAMVMVLGMSLTAFATNAGSGDGEGEPNPPATTEGTVTPPMDSTTTGDVKSGTDADGSFQIIIKDSVYDEENPTANAYKAYQIFKGDLSKAADGTVTLSNIEWGSGVDQDEVINHFSKEVDGNKVALSAREVAELLDGQQFDSELAKEYADKFDKIKQGECENATYNSNEKQYEFNNLQAGYYLVMNSAVPGNAAYTRYMLEVVGKVTATPKRGTTESDKYIKDTYKTPEGIEGVDYFKNNEAPIGGTVEYTIPVKLPENFDDYDSYYLEFMDILSKGLGLPESATVSDKYGISVQIVTDLSLVNGRSVSNKVDVKAVMDVITEDSSKAVEAKSIFGAKVTTENFSEEQMIKLDGKEGTLIEVWTHDLKDLKGDDNKPVAKSGTWVILTYSAVVNEEAVIGTGNPNYVSVKFSNDPNNSGKGETEPGGPEPSNPTGETPEKEVNTYTTELAILKTNEDGNILADAEFTLTGSNGVKITLINQETFVKDAEGAYWKIVKDGEELYTLTSPDTKIDGVPIDNTAYEKEGDVFVKYKKTVKTFVDKQIGVDTEIKDVAVGEDGRIVFTGLGEGSYTLKESHTPAGYNTIDDITFDIRFNKDTQEFSVVNASAPISLGSNNTLQTDIVNQSGSILPSTGGIGTTIFYVVGGILVLGAGVLLVAKKRMSNR